jgi:hypothetical protein
MAQDIQREGSNDNAADGPAETPEAYPPSGKDDAVEATGRVEEVVGEDFQGSKGLTGPAGDPVEGKR